VREDPGHIDHSVYPDTEAPGDLVTEAEKADHLHRVLSAFDHGVVPDAETLELLRGWKRIFDRFPMKASPAYHALRSLFGWESVERLPSLAEPTYVKLDRIEGREDGFEDRV
jgi:hypothetical protein